MPPLLCSCCWCWPPPGVWWAAMVRGPWAPLVTWCRVTHWSVVPTTHRSQAGINWGWWPNNCHNLTSVLTQPTARLAADERDKHFPERNDMLQINSISRKQRSNNNMGLQVVRRRVKVKQGESRVSKWCKAAVPSPGVWVPPQPGRCCRWSPTVTHSNSNIILVLRFHSKHKPHWDQNYNWSGASENLHFWYYQSRKTVK